MVDNKLRVLFWGSGAIGSLFGGLLSLSQNLDIILLGRDPHVATIQNKGLLIKKRSKRDLRIQAIQGYSILPKQTITFDVVFVKC